MTQLMIQTDHAWTYLSSYGGTLKRLVESGASYAVDGCRFSEAYKQGLWDGRVRLVEYDRASKRYRFPTGLLTRVEWSLPWLRADDA